MTSQHTDWRSCEADSQSEKVWPSSRNHQKSKKTSELTSVLEGTETNLLNYWKETVPPKFLTLDCNKVSAPSRPQASPEARVLLAQGYGSSLRVKWLVVDTAGWHVSSWRDGQTVTVCVVSSVTAQRSACTTVCGNQSPVLT